MNTKTIQKLNDLNHTFYNEMSEPFSNTRKFYWSGWSNLPKYFSKGMKVLDIGCGNARFASFLQEKVGEFEYTGIDLSESLLDEAKALNIPNSKFINHDIVSKNIDTVISEKYDLIVLFGLLHHIPSFENRVNLLRFCKEHLTPEGACVATSWQFATDPRFKDKTVEMEEIGLDLDLIEKGDYILNWGNSESDNRYAHFIDAAEEERLITESKIEIIKTFLEDGKGRKLNKYLIFR